jgi:RHS repeat-associated protein
MTSSTVSATARTYAYNGDGLLKSRTQGATTTQFLWDPSSSPSRLLMQGSDKIVYGLGPLWVVKADGTTSSFARDGGKSVRAEVNGAGTVTASFRYRAYGAIAQSNGASMPAYLGYAGQLQDPSGLLYVRARWYDPNVGRFTTRDPLAAESGQPSNLNGFGYAGGNPALLSDPTGLSVAFESSSEGCVSQDCMDYQSPESSGDSSADGSVPLASSQALSVGVVANGNVGIGIGGIGTYVTYQVGIWHTPSGWVATATMGSGKITGATVGVGLQGALSNAQSGDDLFGKFDQRGFSIGEGLQATGDYATGARGVWVASGGLGVSGKFPPIEGHSVTIDTLFANFWR